MEVAVIREIVKEIITETVEKERGTQGIVIAGDDSLIDGGFLDSLGAIQIIEALSERFEVIFYPAELSLDNFDSIDKIALFIKAKLNGDEA